MVKVTVPINKVELNLIKMSSMGGRFRNVKIDSINCKNIIVHILLTRCFLKKFSKQLKGSLTVKCLDPSTGV